MAGQLVLGVLRNEFGGDPLEGLGRVEIVSLCSFGLALLFGFHFLRYQLLKLVGNFKVEPKQILLALALCLSQTFARTLFGTELFRAVNRLLQDLVQVKVRARAVTAHMQVPGRLRLKI